MLHLLRSRIASTTQSLLSRSTAALCCCSYAAGPSTSWQGQILGQMKNIRQFSATSIDMAKVKIKTHRGAVKRWRALPSGQYKRKRPGKRHLNTKFTAARLRRLGQTAYAAPADKIRLKRLLPGYD